MKALSTEVTSEPVTHQLKFPSAYGLGFRLSGGVHFAGRVHL